MAQRVELPQLLSGYLSAEKMNEVFVILEDAFDRTLFRDGTVPNSMDADLDLNGHSILNAASDITNPLSVPTMGQVQDFIAEHSSGVVVQHHERVVATAGQTVVNFSTLQYASGVHNLAVYVNGVRKFTPTDYAETDSNTITFTSTLSLNDKVDVFTNEYLATLAIADHVHTWAQIENVPSFASRWPTWDEVSGKPTTFASTTHNHAASEINTGRIIDAVRGVYVQSTQPTGLGAGNVGVLWLW